MNELEIRFLKDTVTVIGKNAISSGDVYIGFIEFLHINEEDIKTIYKNEYTDVSLKYMVSHIVLHALYGDIIPNEDIIKSIKNTRNIFFEKARIYLDEKPPIKEYETLTPKERYKQYNDINIQVKCNLSLDKFTLDTVETYYPNTLDEVCYILFIKMVINDLTMKRCANCNQYFIKRPGYNNEYCNREVLGKNKTCKDIGAVKRYRQNNIDEYQKIFEKHYKKVKSYTYRNYMQEEFSIWLGKAQSIRDLSRKKKKAPKLYEKILFWLEKRIIY